MLLQQRHDYTQESKNTNILLGKRLHTVHKQEYIVFKHILVTNTTHKLDK